MHTLIWAHAVPLRSNCSCPTPTDSNTSWGKDWNMVDNTGIDVECISRDRRLRRAPSWSWEVVLRGKPAILKARDCKLYMLDIFSSHIKRRLGPAILRIERCDRPLRSKMGLNWLPDARSCLWSNPRYAAWNATSPGDRLTKRWMEACWCWNRESLPWFRNPFGSFLFSTITVFKEQEKRRWASDSVIGHVCTLRSRRFGNSGFPLHRRFRNLSFLSSSCDLMSS